MSRQEMSPKSRTLDPARTVSDLKELRALTGDANGAQRVAFTETWATGRKWLREKLQTLHGKAFDDHYMQAMVEDHDKAVKLFGEEELRRPVLIRE